MRPCRSFIAVADVPEWAGLKYARLTSGGWATLRTVKNAPELHREKVEESVLSHLRGIFYYRYWRLRKETPSYMDSESGGSGI